MAEILVTSPLGTETVTTWDAAWHRMLELPVPTQIRFKRWVTKAA